MVSIKDGPRGFRVRLVCFAFLLSVMCWPARAQAPGDHVIELRASIAAALQRSGTLQASAASARAAAEDAVAAAQRPDPVLRLSLDNLPVNGPDRWSTTRDFMTMRSIGVMQTLTSERKRQVRARRFEREADAARAQRLMQAADVQRQTAVAWFELYAAQQRRSLLYAQRDEARRQVLAAEAAARAGRGSQTEWIAAREALWRLEQMGLQTEAERRDTQRALQRWTGLPVAGPLGQPPLLSPSPENADALLDRHPALRAMQARTEVARAAAALANAERDPDWSVELMLSQRGNAYSDMVSVGVSIPLAGNRVRRQDRDLAARLAEVDALDAELTEARRARAQEITEWREALETALAQRALIDRERVPLAAQRTEAALAAYRAGAAPLATVLAAREASLALALERVEVELRAARHWAALDALQPANSAIPFEPAGR